MVVQSIKLWSRSVVVLKVCFRHPKIGDITNRRHPGSWPRCSRDTADTIANLTLFPTPIPIPPHPRTPQRSFTSAGIGLVSLPIQRSSVELQFHADPVVRTGCSNIENNEKQRKTIKTMKNREKHWKTAKTSKTNDKQLIPIKTV